MQEGQVRCSYQQTVFHVLWELTRRNTIKTKCIGFMSRVEITVLLVTHITGPIVFRSGPTVDLHLGCKSAVTGLLWFPGLKLTQTGKLTNIVTIYQISNNITSLLNTHYNVKTVNGNTKIILACFLIIYLKDLEILWHLQCTMKHSFSPFLHDAYWV